MRKMWIASLLAMFTIAILISSCEKKGWKTEFDIRLPKLGHRNWILIADSAYPAQSNPGIKTVVTGADHIEVVETVLAAIDKAQHIRASVYLDSELEWVSEDHAPGIEEYRKTLTFLLSNRAIKSILHEELIDMLDRAAETFDVLVLKTSLTLPYTSVFIELNCGYWNQKAEENLRKAIRGSG